MRIGSRASSQYGMGGETIMKRIKRKRRRKKGAPFLRRKSNVLRVMGASGTQLKRSTQHWWTHRHIGQHRPLFILFEQKSKDQRDIHRMDRCLLSTPCARFPIQLPPQWQFFYRSRQKTSTALGRWMEYCRSQRFGSSLVAPDYTSTTNTHKPWILLY